MPHLSQCPHPTHEPDVFDIMNEVQADEGHSPSRPSGMQKRHNQWWQWSEDIIPALLTLYMHYLEASWSLRVIVDPQVSGSKPCNCTVHWPNVCCLFFNRKLFTLCKY